MGARRLVFLSAQAAVCLAGFCGHVHAQGREKRVTPVDATQRATFERERKVGVAILVGVGKYPRYSGLGELRYPARDADLLEAELSTQRYTVINLKDAEATRGAILNAIRQAGEVIDAERGTLVFSFRATDLPKEVRTISRPTMRPVMIWRAAGWISAQWRRR